MFALASYNTKNQCAIGKVTTMLLKVLNDTYAGRRAFDFLIENCASAENYPDDLPIEFHPKTTHELSMIKLALWKTLGNPETYLVTEDERVKLITTKVSGMTGIEIKVVNSKEALDIINSLNSK